MALILNIETSSPACSVCISRNGKLILEKEERSEINHASVLSVFIGQVFKEAKLEMNQLDAIAVSAGPGSYTGLRIGVVTAKGLCFALEKPLISIDSLQALSIGLEKKYSGDNFLYCPTIDARRNEIYFGLYGKSGEEILSSRNFILTEAMPFQITRGQQAVIGGSGAFKCRSVWSGFSIIFDEVVSCSAVHMIQLAEKKFSHLQFENSESFEPRYVKPVYINPPKTG